MRSLGILRKRRRRSQEGEVLGKSDTGSLLFPPLFTTLLIKFMFVSVCTASIFYNFPLQMNLKKKMGKQGPLPKRRRM